MDPSNHISLLAFGHTILSVVLGLGCLLAAAILLPKILDHFSPEMDEKREILNGNRAMGDYFGRVVGSLLIGISIIIAAAIIAGLG